MFIKQRGEFFTFGMAWPLVWSAALITFQRKTQIELRTLKRGKFFTFGMGWPVVWPVALITFQRKTQIEIRKINKFHKVGTKINGQAIRFTIYIKILECFKDRHFFPMTL